MNKKNKPINILLVEDTKFDREIFKKTFEEAEIACKITECTDAEEALGRLKADASCFDIAVIDHTLPDTTGLELSKKIKEDKFAIPIVLLTGTGSEEIAVEAMKAGIDDYIVKGSEIHKYTLAQQILKTVKYSEESVARKKVEETLKKTNEELSKNIERLEKFQKLTVGRELEMVKLKNEINGLLERLGEPKKYDAPGNIQKKNA